MNAVKKRSRHALDEEEKQFCRQIGAQIRYVRRAKGISQRALAEMAGVSPTFMSDVENQRSIISVARLVSIAKALEVPVSYLIGENVPLNHLLGAAEVLFADEISEESNTYGSLEYTDFLLLNTLLSEDGFIEILRAFEGFQNWNIREKREILGLLTAKRENTSE